MATLALCDGVQRVKNFTLSMYVYGTRSFASIKSPQRDLIDVGSTMKDLVDSRRFRQALSFYSDLPNDEKDGVVHLLALKSCALYSAKRETKTATDS